MTPEPLNSPMAIDPTGERAALKLVRMAVEQVCPAGVLPSEEWVTGRYGPEPIHEGEALAKRSLRRSSG